MDCVHCKKKKKEKEKEKKEEKKRKKNKSEPNWPLHGPLRDCNSNSIPMGAFASICTLLGVKLTERIWLCRCQKNIYSLFFLLHSAHSEFGYTMHQNHAVHCGGYLLTLRMTVDIRSTTTHTNRRDVCSFVADFFFLHHPRYQIRVIEEIYKSIERHIQLTINVPHIKICF